MTMLIFWKVHCFRQEKKTSGLAELSKKCELSSSHDKDNKFHKIQIPKLDCSHDWRTEVKSKNDGNKIYLNMYKMTCTCDRFNHNHSSYEVEDIRRMCKHLLQEYRKLVDISILDEFKIAVLNYGHDVKENILFLEEIEVKNCEQVPIILYDKSNPWWDIYAPNIAQELTCYGFNIIEERWSRKEAPPVIKNDLERFFAKYLSTTQNNIDDDFLKIRAIVMKINTIKDLRNLERRLKRAEKRHESQETTVLDENKLDILYRSFDIARDKVF